MTREDMTAGQNFRTMPSLLAECRDCSYVEDVSGTSESDSARQRAKRHAERTGHEVRVERIIATYFNSRHAERTGMTEGRDANNGKVEYGDALRAALEAGP